MSLSLEEALLKAQRLIEELPRLSRVVMSGRRRNYQPAFERVVIRPVKIKDEIKYQVIESNGQQDFTKNLDLNQLKIESYLQSGFANILVEMIDGTYSIRITKKGEALVFQDNEPHLQILEHNRTKKRLLEGNDPFLIKVGISDSKGVIKPTKQDKYLQVEEFLRIMVPTIEDAIETGKLAKPTKEKPLNIVDLGCGNAYLTFAVHQYLSKQNVPVKVTGIDLKSSSVKTSNDIAKSLNISNSIHFNEESIAINSVNECDIAIALHACDTATDDAIAWSVKKEAKIILVAPCCHHDLQVQMTETPEPWQILTKFGLVKERLGDLITDSLRAQILKIKGYRTEIIEFIASDHTPRNLLIRAVLTQAVAKREDLESYKKMCEEWKIEPALASRLNVID